MESFLWVRSLAYLTAFLCGLVYTTLLNIRVAFSGRLNPRVTIAHASCGTAYFFINIFLMHLLIDRFDLPAALAPVPALAITFPIYFIAARSIVVRFGRTRTR